MWYDLIPINGGPSYTWKNVRGGEKSMTVRAEGRWTGIAQLGHSQHHIGTSAAQSWRIYTSRLSKIALENKYPLDWPQKVRPCHIHLTTPLTGDTRARESESSQYSHPPYLKRSIGISEPQPETVLLFSAAPAPEHGTQGKGRASSLRGPYSDKEYAN